MAAQRILIPLVGVRVSAGELLYEVQKAAQFCAAFYVYEPRVTLQLL